MRTKYFISKGIVILITITTLTIFIGCSSQLQETQNGQPIQTEQSGRINGGNRAQIVDKDKPQKTEDFRGSITKIDGSTISIKSIPDMSQFSNSGNRPSQDERQKAMQNAEIKTFTISANAKIKKVSFNGQSSELSTINISDITVDQTATIWLDEKGNIIYMQLMTMSRRPNNGGRRTMPPH